MNTDLNRTRAGRTAPATREQQILDAAVRLAESHGYMNITRTQIAQAAGVADSLVSCYLGTMAKMRERVMREAVRGEVLRVVAQGIACKDRIANRAPRELRERALASITPKAR